LKAACSSWLPKAGPTSAVEYSRFTGFQGDAAQQATEGSAKAAFTSDYTLITQPSLTVAGYSKMSRQALNDSAELARSVEATIRHRVMTQLSVLLATGGTNLTGGFNALAGDWTSTAYDRLPDAVSECLAGMQVIGMNPDTVVMHPTTWATIVTAQDDVQAYLSGSYLGTLDMQMRGLKVVLATGVAVGKAMVIDSTHVELFVADDFSIELAYSGDDFTKNLCTILGETRVTPVYRTVGAAYLVTPAP